MALKQYKEKRDFSKTNEPSSFKANIKNKEKHVFVIQKHDARNLHYDLRLEINGVLKSWAVPKKPSNNSSIKRLAIETEDHPLSYKDFEGSIPEGQYGAGTVEIWDKGEYENKNIKNQKKISMKKAYDNGEIIVRLKGKKLKGDFALIKTRYQKNSWLLIKKNEE